MIAALQGNGWEVLGAEGEKKNIYILHTPFFKKFLISFIRQDTFMRNNQRNTRNCKKLTVAYSHKSEESRERKIQYELQFLRKGRRRKVWRVDRDICRDIRRDIHRGQVGNSIPGGVVGGKTTNLPGRSGPRGKDKILTKGSRQVSLAPRLAEGHPIPTWDVEQFRPRYTMPADLGPSAPVEILRTLEIKMTIKQTKKKSPAWGPSYHSKDRARWRLS